MDIKILGPGCPKCKTLEKVTREAVSESGITATIEKVEDIVKIMEYHVMHTPVLVINEKVVLSGQVPTVNQVKEILIKNQQINII
ncbi:MAG: TM0996/MTH895 family glutaredoxin-like protein [Bacteroidales bacterium]|nr:TM0996/MTH895 family glutaredoxin-like protein [Bacteroidales bacterium]